MLPREPEVEAEKGPGRGVENRNHPSMMEVGISIDRRGSKLVSPDKVSDATLAYDRGEKLLAYAQYR